MQYKTELAEMDTLPLRCTRTVQIKQCKKT